jgi:ribosome-binding factor A
MGLRQERLADEIRDLIAGCFLGGQMGDPRLESVTITAVKLSPDLQLATVYFRIYGEVDDGMIQRATRGLESAGGFFRKRLADALDIRRIPSLRFFYDESIERGARIEKLLGDLD